MMPSVSDIATLPGVPFPPLAPTMVSRHPGLSGVTMFRGVTESMSRAVALAAGLSVAVAACATPDQSGAAAENASTTNAPAVVAAPATTPSVAFEEVPRPAAQPPDDPAEPEDELKLCGVPISEAIQATGPRSEPGTAGLLRPGNAPEGVRLRGNEIRMADGAVLADVHIPDDVMIRVEPGASVTIERVAASDAWIFMEEGSNLTMRDSDLTRMLTADNWYVVDGNGDGGLLEHNRFRGGEAATIFLRSDSSNWTISNNEISGGEDGFKPGGTGHVIEDNWIHDLATGQKLSSGAERHSDGLQLQGGNIDLTIRCNYIDSSVDGANAAIIIKPDLGEISTVDVSGNVMAGGAYTMFSIVEGTEFPMAGVVVGDNVFLAGTGFYGSVAIDNDATTFTDNTDERNEPVTRP